MPAAISAASPAVQSTQSSARIGLADNYDTFLQLLTSQLQNQDPLSPVDSTQFVSQLVEFSSVEQQIAQTEALENLIALQSSSQNHGAVNYLGREVGISGPQAPLSDGEARWIYQTQGRAAAVSIAVQDANGRVVYETTGSTATGVQSFTWDGRDAAGRELPEGVYTLSIGATDASGQALDTAITGYGVVTALDLTQGEPILVLGDMVAGLNRLVDVRAPRPAAAA